jgi:cellobiose transport system permease protein
MSTQTRTALHRGRRRPGGTGSPGRPNKWTYAFLTVVIVGGGFPFYWSLIIGSGDETTVRDPDKPLFPSFHFFSNAAKVVDNPTVNFWQALFNSIVVATTVSISVVFFSALAGFAFAKLRFRGRRGLLLAVIGTMAVPMQLGVVPLFIVMAKVGWTGTLGAVILPNLVTAFGVFWMTQYISQAIPDELIEAARIDGAGPFATFVRVVLPVIRPAAAMLGLFTFIMTWTDFFWPFIVLDSDSPTLPVSLRLLQANYFVDYSVVLAGALLATAPLLVLFAVAGRQLVTGIMQGAVKG